jgi:hypothetical protein
MLTTYNDYNRDRIGWFFGLSGWQLAVLAASALPVFGCLQRGACPQRCYSPSDGCWS